MAHKSLAVSVINASIRYRAPVCVSSIRAYTSGKTEGQDLVTHTGQVSFEFVTACLYVDYEPGFIVVHTGLSLN